MKWRRITENEVKSATNDPDILVAESGLKTGLMKILWTMIFFEFFTLELCYASQALSPILTTSSNTYEL